MKIDTTFDFREDSNGKDPDYASKTLKNYHKLLWQKHLPDGRKFNLSESSSFRYLVGQVEDEQHFLTSDTICNSYVKRKSMKPIVEPLLQDIEVFRKHVYSMAGFILFPGKKVAGLRTINQERGWLKNIDDRFDITLDCIRRFYLGEATPLSVTLNRYSTFFELFRSFRGYVEFFLLDDLVDSDYSSVKYFLPLSSAQNVLPTTTEEYAIFMKNAQTFLQNRNKRIESWCQDNLK